MKDLKEPRLIITKSKRTLEVCDGDKHIQSYTIVLGFDPNADKEIEGDGRTPEGDFYVFTKNPESKFHLSLGLSYPGKEDAERGLKQDLITQEEHDEIIAAIAELRMPLQKTKLGGEIYIHGGGTASDWTDGCVALDNNQMTELFDAIPVGAKVTINP
ncbi:MAG TPA: L,D-transpeptidase family protein [Pyrinomonadaceae bacterium]|nr:L,D-transpeptidase family protein [Pyrinomonadaceae bacterium]